MVVAWTWSDGWILMSLYLARSGAEAELYEVMAFADATNHAIPTTKELSSAFTKLVRCELISVNDGKYKLASEKLPSIRKASRAKGGLFQSGKKGFHWLQKSGLVEKNRRRVIIRETKAKVAYDEYIKKFWKS